MVIVNLMGGLGNQMFQYATAKRLSLSLKTELRVDVSGFGKNTRNREHTYQLGQFNIQASHATSTDLRRFRTRKRGHFRFIPDLRKWGFRRRESTSGTNFYEETGGSCFKPEILKLRNDTYLYGYFNSYKYFDSIRKELLPEYTPKSGLTDDGRRTESLIEKTGSISIHFRRGDYVDDPEIRKGIDGIITEPYFRNALAVVIEKTPDPHLFVFSNDIAWVKENHSFPCDVTFVDFNPPQRGYEDLWLMSRCKHNITAGGSTFSWWAAYLNPNKDKIVVRTKDVNNDPRYNHSSDYFPPEWVVVPSS
jgi:hypothetical protein